MQTTSEKALAWRWALQLASTDGTNCLLYQSHLCQAVKWIKLFSPLYEKPPAYQRRGGVRSGQALHRQGKTIHQRQTTMHSLSLAPRNTTCELLVPCDDHRAGTHSQRMSQTMQHLTGQRPSKLSTKYLDISWICFDGLPWNIASELAIIWIFFSRHSAQDNLVWYLDCSHSNMKSRSSILPTSRRNCFQLVPLHQEGKAASHPQEKARKKNGKQLWVSLLGGAGGGTV